jgi:hypothetical protein
MIRLPPTTPTPTHLANDASPSTEFLHDTTLLPLRRPAHFTTSDNRQQTSGSITTQQCLPLTSITHFPTLHDTELLSPNTQPAPPHLTSPHHHDGRPWSAAFVTNGGLRREFPGTWRCSMSAPLKPSQTAAAVGSRCASNLPLQPPTSDYSRLQQPPLPPSPNVPRRQRPTTTHRGRRQTSLSPGKTLKISKPPSTLHSLHQPNSFHYTTLHHTS